VRCFVGELKKQIPDIPVTFYDERFTSVLAHRAILDSGVGKQRRRDKELVDTVAATIILQDYMSSQEHLLC
jgi:putative Holliday junction resolvase